MSLKETDFHLIDKYLQSQLDAKEEKLFVEKQNDPDFRKELDLRKNSLSVFKKNGRQELKNKLQYLEKEIQGESAVDEQPTKVRKIRSRAWIGVAAALLLLMGMFWWNTQSVNSNQLFTQHFQPYPNIIAPLVKSQTPSTSEYELAFQTYEQGNYENAISLLEKINTEEGKFYLAVSYLANGNSKKAIPLLSELNKASSSRFYQASQWYLALAYLKNNQTDKAADILDLIKEKPKHNFYKQAMEID